MKKNKCKCECANDLKSVLTILGVSSALLLDAESKLDDEQKFMFMWIVEAIDRVVYQNKDLPPTKTFMQ